MMKDRELVNAQGRVGTTYVEMSETNAVIEILNDLITANREVVHVYQTAVDRLKDETNNKLLQGFAEQHETFVSELSNLVTSYSGAPATGADGGILIKKAAVTLKAIFKDGDNPILTVVAEEAEKVLEAYREAMNAELPDDARELIRQQMSQSRLTYEKLSALSTAYNG